ncbi:MAG: VWA domain-containing protein [Acidobacteriota bacterium]
MPRFVVSLTCVFGLVALAPHAWQGPPPVTFRSGVDLVDVDVSVLDRHRLPVRGLTSEDFTIFEDGQPRPVAAFTAVELKPRVLPSATWMADVAPDVQDNDVAREGRLVVILIDRNVSFEQQPAAVRYAEAAVNQLRPGDLAAVAYSSFGIPQNFTADRQRLLAAIRQPAVGLPRGDSASPAECMCGTCSLQTVGRIAEALLPVRQRRKVLFVIGNNLPINSTGRCGGVLGVERERAIRALEAANVTVYAFDPSGLETQSVSASASAVPTARPAMAAMIRRGNLSVLPDHTGGRVVLDPVRAADRMAEVFRESDAYYVLGFQPRAAPARARFHDIRVKVARSGVTVQARRGYYTAGAPAPTNRRSVPSPDNASTRLAAAIAGLWPKTDVSLLMSVAPFASPDLRSAVLAVVVGVRGEVSRASAAPGPFTTDVLAGVFDRNGRSLGSVRQTVSVTLQRDQPFDYETFSHIDLAPGRYEVRTAVEDGRTGQAGSVYGYVDVPDFVRDPVSLSGLMMAVGPMTPSPILRDILPGTPTARRAFLRDERVSAFVRVYQGLSRAMIPGYLTAEIRDDQNQSVFHQESRILPQQFGAGRAMDFSLDVPTDRLPSGAYLLSIEARHGNETARREARFSLQ